MNEETSKLIRELADKLGTTAEHLWSVLVKQAPISSATDCVGLVVLWIIMGISFVELKKLVTKDDDWRPVYIIWVVCALGVTVLSCITVQSVLAGFFNPEYWALQQLLNKK